MRAILCVFVVIVLALIAIFACCAMKSREDFANIDEKVVHLREWIQAQPRAPYTEYIAANPESNIVEYARLRQLQSRGRLLDTRALRDALRV